MEVKITKNDIMKKIIAFLLIVVLTMFDFALLGVEAVSYAVDALSVGTQTNNKNVTFDAYFKDASGASITSKEANIESSDIKLFTQVSVKNEGYFNGTITIEDSNFKLKSDAKNTAINKIEGNKITLNQINSGETIELELGIEPIKEDTINFGLLNMSSKILIDGIYRNSEQRDIKISANREVQLVLTSPYADNEGLELTNNIITNKIYTINGENKRIVQVLVASGLKDNKYPIKENNIEVSVPQGVEKVEVTSQGTFATNGKGETDFNQNNWTYSEKDQKVNITIKNDAQDGKVKWPKNGKDNIVITYTLNIDAKISGNDITAKSKITLLDTKSTTKELTTTAKVQEEKEGVISTGTELEETSIYKGKIYSGENRDYKVTTNIYANESETGSIVDVNLEQSVYVTAGGEIPANAQFKNITVSKSDVERILGQDGNLTITSADGNKIDRIAQDTPTDENGNVVIEYPEGITALRVQSTVVKQNGTIAIKSTKTLKQDGNSKETKRTYTSLKEIATGSEAIMTLNETETKTELNINKTKLSTLSTNENFEITATLITDNEKYDLYKNPTFEITLPESIKSINVKTLQPMYADMFNVKEATVADGNNGAKVIRLALEGEQVAHSSTVNQTTLVISADIEFDLLTPSNKSAVSMTYTNENALNGNYTESKEVDVESKYGLLMVTTMDGYNEDGESVKTMDDEVAKGSLNLETSSKVATVKETIVNNYDETMQNVSIIGRIPTEGMNDGTINTTLAKKVTTTLANAEILYSEDANAKAEDNTWKTSSEGAKSFKIKVGELAKGIIIDTEYSFNIPEGITYGQSIYTKVDTIYTYLGNNMQQTSTVGAETPKLTGIRAATLKNSVENVDGGIKTNIATITAGKELKDGDSIYEGQALQYTIYITNNTGKDLKNAKISIEQENGTLYGLKEMEVCSFLTYQVPDWHIEHMYSELDTNKKELETIENFENGKTVAFRYEIVVNEVESEAQTKGKISIKADEFEGKTINTISNKIEQAELKINYKYYRFEEAKLYYGDVLETQLTIRNITNKELNNIKAKISLPNGTYASDSIYSSYKDGKIDRRISNVKYNETDNTITFNINELKPGADENVSAIFYIDVKEFKGDSIDLVFMAQADTDENTYYSNQMVKNYNNILKEISLTQETNINQETILDDTNEFNIIITAKNETDKNVKATITDELPDCFVIKGAHAEVLDSNEEINITQYDNQDNINFENENYIINRTTGSSYLNITKQLNAKQQIKITLDVEVNTNSAEDSVKNIAKLNYGEEKEDGRFEYVVKKEAEKIFYIKPLAQSEDISNLGINQTANIENKSVINDGQEIIYETTIENKGEQETNVSIEDILPSGLNVKEIKINSQDVLDSLSEDGIININNYVLAGKETANLKIVANYNQSDSVEEEMSNIVTVTNQDDTISSNAITYYPSYIESDYEEENTEDNSEDINSPNDITDNNTGLPTEEKTNNGENTNIVTNQEGAENNSSTSNDLYTISGLAWLDKNKNGQKDSDEELMQGIEVKAIDVESGNFAQRDGKDITTTTSENGKYTIELQRGNYVIVFMYDTDKYAATQYQKTGISNSINSDVITKTVEANGNSFEAATTDTIKLISEDIENINIGLVENTKFDFELNKYINEITVKTAKGVNTYNYDNAELAKVEIHAKELENANVIIKYTMRVRNNGEIAGYVKDITDYIPSSLTFNSELNTDWYQSDKNLHNTSLTNTKINAGETKDVTLILTKTMTESNTGLISNLAELADVYNEMGADDLDSTPNNRAQGEDDLGKADVIISVKTGALVMYVGIVIAILVIIGAGAYMINKKVLKNNNIEEDIEF